MTKIFKTHRVQIGCFAAIVTLGSAIIFDRKSDSPTSEPSNSIEDPSHALASLPFLEGNDRIPEPADPSSNEESKDEAIELIVELTAEEKLAKALSSLAERIAADGKELKHPIVGADGDYFELRNEILMIIEENPELVNLILDGFIENPNSLLAREFSSVLSEIGSPEIQTAVLDIGLDSYLGSHADRTAAIFVIANMDQIEPETRDRLLESYAHTEDSELLQFSLMALKPALSSADDHARVHDTLLETLQTPDANVRRHAIHQMGEWANSNQALEPLRAMAIEETDINARARAVGSIASSGFKSPENKAVLWQVAQNPNEWGAVRQTAVDALKGYVLEPEHFDNIKSLETEIYQAISDELQRDQ